MKRLLIALFLPLFLLTPEKAEAQRDYAFGFKGGPSLCYQLWSTRQQQVMIKYHFAAFMESAPKDNKNAIYAQFGYHIRGSANRQGSYYNGTTGQEVPARTYTNEWKNLAFVVGGKQKFDVSHDKWMYYLLGIRMDYNIDTELEYYDAWAHGTNTITWGLDIGGGFEYHFSDLVGGIVELRVSPDFGKQLYLPPGTGWTNPHTGQPTTYPEQNVYNLTVELSVGLRFIRRVIYID